jgi:hypothetical protein
LDEVEFEQGVRKAGLQRREDARSVKKRSRRILEDSDDEEGCG